MPNQTPEQIARDAIDAQLRGAGWAVQDKNAINFHEGQGQAIREYLTDSGPASPTSTTSPNPPTSRRKSSRISKPDWKASAPWRQVWRGGPLRADAIDGE